MAVLDFTDGFYYEAPVDVPEWALAGDKMPEIIFRKSKKAKAEKTEIEELEEAVNRKNKRGFKQSMAKRQNRAAVKEFDVWFRDKKFDDHTENCLVGWRNSCTGCSSKALFRQHYSNDAVEFMGAMTCKHKMCFVCNMRRSKEVRRIYYHFFQKNEDLLSKFNLMHLTLTLPHDENGYKGKKYYAPELMKIFNGMRKCSWWKRMVYAGEFGIEFTKTENGFHIHLHSLLLVHQSEQNRNKLHKEILLYWNRATMGGGTRKKLTKEHQDKILSGNKSLTAYEVRKMEPTGATIIGLESLYQKTASGKKVYIKKGDDFDRIMCGIMECIKYHFEPKFLKKSGGNSDKGNGDDESIDFDMMAELLPLIHGKPLYQRFGAFSGRNKNRHPDYQMLNLSPSKDAKEAMMDEMGATATDEVRNPVTLEIAQTEDYVYLTTNLTAIYWDARNHYRPKIPLTTKRKFLNARNLGDAITQMQDEAINSNYLAPKSKWKKLK